MWPVSRVTVCSPYWKDFLMGLTGKAMCGSGIFVRPGGTARTAGSALAAQAEVGDQLGVAVLVGLLEVVQQLAALVDHLQKATAGVVILLVRFEVRRKAVDPLRQQCNLDFRGAGIGLATT